MKMTGAQILIQALIDQGVDLLFGYPGGTVLDIYDALFDKRAELRHILAVHEQGAAHAADGYARSTGKTGVALATSGPGATNLITGIATAFLDSVPLVAVTGNVPLEKIGRDSFQEVDATGLTNPIVKHNYFVQKTSDIAATVREAFTVANSGRKGPVHIDIPKNLTSDLAEYEPLPRFTVRPAPEPDAVALEGAATVIRMAERPLIYAGGGVVFSDASPRLRRFAEALHTPVCTSMMGLSALPAGHPLNLGMAGVHGTPAANRATRECDLLIVVGARFSDRGAANRERFAPRAKIVHIDIDKSEMSKNVGADLALVGDSGAVLSQLLELVPHKEKTAWAEEMVRHQALHPIPLRPAGAGISQCRTLLELRRILPDDAIVVTDVGQHQLFAAQHFPFVTPRTFLSSCGLGTMGYGMGAAIGAKLGNPGRTVALVTGDGSFHMNMGELAVAVTHDLPVVAVVMNNGLLGMVHQYQAELYHGRYAYTVPERRTDYVKLAEALGAAGFRARTADAVAPTLREAFACGRPCVVECVVEPGERVFPMPSEA